MPPATGFQYTPPSYLVRASDQTNRPWNKTEEGEGGHENEFVGDNEYDLPQEERPQTRRESHLDAHFQQRVRNKQSRYRDILSGEADFVDENQRSESNAGEDDDSVIAAAKNADSFAGIHSAKLNVQSATNNEHARKSRKQRITGISDPKTSSLASDAENARSLRAHRLRANLLKQTNDEYEMEAKLEARRRARREEEAVARMAERAAMLNNKNLEQDSEAKRKEREENRLSEEAKREAMALAKEEASVALLRAAELNEERIRQRDRDQLLEQYRQEEEKMSRRDGGSKKKGSNRHMRAKRYFSDTDTWMTDFDAENDFAFLNDLSGIIRDSGLVNSCGSCFGSGDDAEENAFFKSKACATISSVFVPDLSPASDTSASEDGGMMGDSESVRRSREYARYRE